MSATVDRAKDKENPPSLRMSDEDLRGRTAISAEGRVIGEVTALFFNSRAWRVESLRVKLRKEIADRLGIDRSVFRAGTLEIPVRLVQAVGDTVVLSIETAGLRDLILSEGETETPPPVPEEDEAHP
jgi:sporulation protein YlmC with PRC-barrel domain